MKEVLWLISNSLSSIIRNKKRLLTYLFVPLIGILIGIAAYGNTGPTKMYAGVVNHDNGKIAKDTVKFINGINNVKVTTIDSSKVNDQIASGKLDCVIILDSGFSSSVMNGNPDHIEIVSIKGASITGFVKSYVNNYLSNVASLSKASGGDNAAFQKMYDQYKASSFKLDAHSLKDTSKNNDITGQTIGFLIMIMLSSAGGLSEIIIREKENRTYLRLMSSPINSRIYVFSNVVVNMIIMTVQILVTLTVMTKVFHISPGVPFWTMVEVLLIFALAGVGLSLVITSFASTTASAGAMQNLIMTPTCLLAGCFWPVEIMPKTMQKIAEFLPQRWLLDTITQLQKGHSLSSLSMNISILFAFALAFFMIAIYKFSRGNNVRNFI
ncbi:ABC transporter permease [Fictibacillus fluitans]|uniref:Transport permease protein n=1 Tax=Fictibacillus fluitans TaxID=3058422 RepID=A0ABT8HY43_9BACL|nr:ABC transporter permease [Fictibacillus sp. NE201]MDN4525700.1 ABC transporter permease [Fictibacillus sp. NE201]